MLAVSHKSMLQTSINSVLQKNGLTQVKETIMYPGFHYPCFHLTYPEFR